MAVLLLFAACNNQPHPQKPEPDTVIKDTVALNIMRPFYEKPQAEKIYVRIKTKDDGHPCQRNSIIKGLLAAMAPPPQHFIVNPSRPAEICGAQGTKLLLPPHCFVNKAGAGVNDSVIVEMRECFNTADMLANNLTAMVNGHAMQSKGMVFIKATAHGQELQLKSNKAISIQFPFNNPARNGYQLYYARADTGGGLTWAYPATAQPAVANTITGKPFSRPGFSFHGLELKDYLAQALIYPDEARRNELSARVDVSFFVNDKGLITGITTGEAYKVFRSNITEVLQNMPAWQPATYMGKPVSAIVHVVVDYNIRRNNQVVIEPDPEQVALVDNTTGDYLVYNGSETQKIHLQSTCAVIGQLGWYSFQRRLPNAGPVADVIVPDDAGTDVKLVLANGNTVVSGDNCLGYSRFRTLPVNTHVLIVATRAEAGKSYYAIQPLQLKEQNIVALVWHRADKEHIEQRLKHLHV
ncbi:MAG TPA: energy transducer TonB [Chitinophagales bacterium]|nr:energy transducer TonB [Chitinophagales bacterium]